MNRREFLLAAAAAPVALRMRATSSPLAYATADTESHVAVVNLSTGEIVRTIETLPSPFSIERVGETAVVAHTVSGRLTIIGRHVVDGLGEPRYTAAAPDGRHAFVSDSGHKELVAVDVLRGAIVGHVKLSQWPRHLSLSPDGRTLWVSLGTASNRIDVVDVSDPRRPQLVRSITPPFLAHDVGFAPSGRVWITSGDSSSSPGIAQPLEPS